MGEYTETENRTAPYPKVGVFNVLDYDLVAPLIYTFCAIAVSIVGAMKLFSYVKRLTNDDQVPKPKPERKRSRQDFQINGNNGSAEDQVDNDGDGDEDFEHISETENETALVPYESLQQRKAGVKIAWIQKDENNEANTQLVVDMEPLCEILKRPEVADLPVTIVSINGRMRTGKSFLLNLIIKFFQFSTWHHDWIDKELDSSFEWKASLDGVTSGILIWPEPFILKRGGQKIAVILMDTQGIHDRNQRGEDTLKLFGLSMLISSLVIYNDTVHSDDTFKNVYDFVEFTTSLESDINEYGAEGPKFSFGKLLMLFRDWNNKQEYPCGLYQSDDDKEPGDNEEPNLRTYFLDSPGLNERASQVRRNITDAFSEVLVYAMSGPGLRLPDDPRWRQSRKWESEFLICVKQFVRTIFDTQFLMNSTKRVYDNEILARDYARYVRKWGEGINGKTYNFKDSTFLEMHIELRFEKYAQRSNERYKDQMQRFVLNSNGKDIQVYQDELIQEIKRDIWTSDQYKNKQEVYFQQWRTAVKNNLQTFRLELNQRELEAIKGNVVKGVLTTAGGWGVVITGGVLEMAATGGAAAAGVGGLAASGGMTATGFVVSSGGLATGSLTATGSFALTGSLAAGGSLTAVASLAAVSITVVGVGVIVVGSATVGMNLYRFGWKKYTSM